MRKLRADEIECRVAQVTSKGCSLLLYKTARVDRAILDEEFGPMNWQNDFKVIDGKMYGGIAVRDNNNWVWKWDCGTESNTEAEKGQASDCFKRAGFKWGIGVELYSSPFIFVNCPTKQNSNGKYELVNKYVKFSVSEISYSENGDIANLNIVDDNGNSVFRVSKNSKKDEISEHCSQIKLCSSREELETYWSNLTNIEKTNIQIRNVFKEMCSIYPKVIV